MSSWRDPPHSKASYLTQSIVHSLPLRTVSQLFGKISSSSVIPEWLHQIAIKGMVGLYSIDMSDYVKERIESYSTLQEFFTREIKEQSRPIDAHACIVSPVDATVQNIISINKGDALGDAIIENVKGESFRLSNFLQFSPGSISPGESRFAIIFHLSPKDYHGFHAPKNLNIRRTVHVPGKLLPVKLAAIKWLGTGVFSANERVILDSSRCILGIVGASFVGSISLPWEKRVSTNSAQCLSVNDYSEGYKVTKGTKLGHFEFGSCVVLVVDVLQSQECQLRVGERVCVGQAVF